MNLTLLFITGIMIGISGAMIPGSLTIFTVSAALKTNRFAGLKIVLGHIIIEFLVIAIIFLGAHRFLDSKGFVLAVSIIGGLAFIVMGAILFLNSGKMSFSRQQTSKGFSKGLIMGGIFFSAISPGFLIWWATIGVSTIIKALASGIIGVLVLTLGHWLADLLWYWSVSYAVDKGKTYLTDSWYQNIIKLLSIALVGLGAIFLISASA